MVKSNMGIFDKAVSEILKEDFEKDGFYVYHGTRPTAEDGIMQKGFERFFTASNGGNMYGAGLYTTYKLSTQGQNARGVYGQLMYKLKVKSLKDFIIYDPDIATKVYGKPDVEFQLKKILSPESFNRIRSQYNYNKLINSKGAVQSSVCALAMCEYLRTYDREAGFKINGFIFSGNHDGWVCYIKDFKNAYPIELSRDCGRTWEPFKGGKNIQKFGIDDVDLQFQLGKHNYALSQSLDYVPYRFINGFARVEKDGKSNFLYRKKPLKDGVISPVWFDYAPDTFTDRGTCNVKIDRTTYILRLDKSTNNFFVYDDEGKYLCPLDKLQLILDTMNSNEDDFGEDEF